MIKHSFDKHFMMLAMVLAASLVGFVTGYTIPLISLRLSSHGTDTVQVGIIASLPAIGMMTSSFIVSYLSRRFSSKHVLSASLFVLAATTIVSNLPVSFFYLVLPRFLAGIAGGIIVILGESWVTGSASDKNKATLTGLYTSAFTGCQLLGPLLLSLGEDFQHFASVPIILISAISIFLIRTFFNEIKSDRYDKVSEQGIFAYLPILASGVFCFAFFDASILALFPLYAIHYGLVEKTAVLLLSVVLLGDAIMQIPIGWLADRYGFKKIHIACGLLFCATAASLPFIFKSPHITDIICFAMGASAGGLYTLSLVRAGKLFSHQRLIAVNAILAIFWSAGSVSGPIMSGALIGYIGYYALPVSFASLGITFIIFQTLPCSSYAKRH